MTFFRIGLFGLSTLGTFELIRKITKDKVDLYFLPSLTIAIQVTILFFAGLLNLLPEVSKLIYLAGLATLIACLWKNKTLIFLKDYINDGYIVSLLIMIIMGIGVKGKLFAHYDNFSHWAMVVRHMLDVNHFPNFESTLIMFQEYPLGSSVYIYYFASLISKSESLQMLAQTYMVIAALLPLFSFVQKRSLKIDLVYIVFVNFVLTYNIKPGDLLVDTLLPAVGICALLFAKKHCLPENYKQQFWLLSFYLIQLIQIKNSGLFFVAVVILVCIKQYLNRQNRLNNLCAAIFPFLSLVLWQKHCKYVFPSVATSKHAMTIENYRSVFGNKTIEDIKTICIGMLRITLTSKDILALLGIAVAIGFCVWFFNKNEWKDYKNCFLFTLILYLCYQTGMLGMYLFSMPGKEATNLAASHRYLKTIVIAILMLYIVFAVKAFSDISINESIKTLTAGILIISIIVLSYISQGKIDLAPATVKNDEERMWIEKNRDIYKVPKYSSYCMLIPYDDAYFAEFLLEYIFQSFSVSSAVVDDPDDLENISSKYIFVYDKENEIINTWISEMYPEQAGNEVIIRED